MMEVKKVLSFIKMKIKAIKIRDMSEIFKVIKKMIIKIK